LFSSEKYRLRQPGFETSESHPGEQDGVAVVRLPELYDVLASKERNVDVWSLGYSPPVLSQITPDETFVEHHPAVKRAWIITAVVYDIVHGYLCTGMEKINPALSIVHNIAVMDLDTPCV